MRDLLLPQHLGQLKLFQIWDDTHAMSLQARLSPGLMRGSEMILKSAPFKDSAEMALPGTKLCEGSLVIFTDTH